MSEQNTYAPPISQDLSMTSIKKFMHTKLVYATPTTSIKTAMQMMLSHNVSGLAVVDDFQVCMGVYSEFDAILQGASAPLDTPIKYSKNLFSVFENSTFKETLILLLKNRLKRLIIIDDQKKAIGIISRRDLMKAIFDDVEKSGTGQK